MTKQTITIDDDADTIETLTGSVPRVERFGPDLGALMQATQTQRQPRYGETIVGAEIRDEHGRVVDEVTIGVTDVVEGNRQSVMVAPDNSNLVAIERRESYVREKLASIVDANGNPKLDAAGRDLYREERYKLHGELAMLGAQRDYESAMQQMRDSGAAIRAQQDAIAAELAARTIADSEAEARLSEHLRDKYGITRQPTTK